MVVIVDVGCCVVEAAGAVEFVGLTVVTAADAGKTKICNQEKCNISAGSWIHKIKRLNS